MKKKIKKFIASTLISAMAISSFSYDAYALGDKSAKEKHGSYYTSAAISCSYTAVTVYGVITNSNSDGRDTGVVNEGFMVTIPISYKYYDPADIGTIYYGGSGVTSYGEASTTVAPPKVGYFFSSASASFVFSLPTRVTISLDA